MNIFRKTSTVIIIFISLVLISPDYIWADYSSEIEAFEYNGTVIPASDSNVSVIINDNIPFFTEAEKAITDTYENYTELDPLNRVGTVQASIDKTSLDTDERGDISSIKPTGWIQEKYDIVSGGWLYNRSHLYAHSLGGDDIEKNLMTGTRAFNFDGMYASSESLILNYIKASEENVHVLYRVTPIFIDNDLLAKGTLMEALCLENPDFRICAFCYNIQPGISIDYATGDNKLTDSNSEEPDDTPKNINEVRLSRINVQTYTGVYIKPAITIKDGSAKLVNDTDYKVTYRNNRYPGKASIIITGTGNYTGSMTVHYYIRPAKMAISNISSKKQSLMISWKKHPGVTAYRIAYRRKGTSKYRYITCKSTTTKKIITSLKKGKSYQIRIRAYKQIDGRKYYGAYSTLKSIKIK